MSIENRLLNIFSEYLDDFTLEEFFDDNCGLTKKRSRIIK